MDFLEEEFEQILNIFKTECEEHLEKFTQNILILEKKPNDPLILAELFRIAHSIKGSSRMIGLNDIQNLAHNIEDLLGLAKDNIITISSSLIDVMCKAIDVVGSLIDKSIETKGDFHSSEVDKMIEEIVAEKERSLKNQSPKQPEKEQSKELIQEEIAPIEQKELTSTIDIISNTNEQMSKLLEEYKEFKNSKSSLIPFIQKADEIEDTLKNFDNTRIKMLISEIKEKAILINKNQNSIAAYDYIIQLEEDLNLFIRNLVEISKDIGLQPFLYNLTMTTQENPDDNLTIKQEENLQKNAETIEKPIEMPKEKQESILDESIIKSISYNIENLNNKFQSKEAALEIINGIEYLLKNITDTQINKLLKNLLDIIKFIKSSSVLPDKEILEVLLQSLKPLEEFTKNGKTEEEPNLIISRLEILKQMLILTEENRNISTNEISVSSANLQQKQQQDETTNVNNNFETSETNVIKTLRISTKKLDSLVNQVGELIIAKIKTQKYINDFGKITKHLTEIQREWTKSIKNYRQHDRKTQKTSEQNLSPQSFQFGVKNPTSLVEDLLLEISNLSSKISNLQKSFQEDDARLGFIVKEIEHMVKEIRVLPLATIFHMFPRMVRDISRSKNKQIEIIISGSETSADKKIIEEIKDPLIHIIRNAIDHGIETPEERIANGKTATGKIFLSAYHLENTILIEVIDDGRGIDLEKIRQKVLKNKLLSEEELSKMSDSQIMNIIFWPGFSTQDSVGDISGRGVGLDVVHNKIIQLNGKVSIKSNLGEGCKISIKLPVTMATLKTFIVSLNNQIYAIPANNIKTTLAVEKKDIFHKEGRPNILVEKQSIPIFHLKNLLGLETDNKTTENEKYTTIIINQDETQIGLIVEKLLGDQEVLHKKLNPPLIRIKNISGITSLGSGEMCLILNIYDLIKMAFSYTETENRTQNENIKQKSSKPKNILIVDDSITTIIYEKNILRKAGYNVLTANDGVEAYAKLCTENIDLLITDIEMPQVDGIKLIEKIKTNPDLENIPVIILTSYEINKADYNISENTILLNKVLDKNEVLKTVKKLLT